MGYRSHRPATLKEVNDAIEGVLVEHGLTRREAIGRGIRTAGGVVGLSLLGAAACKQRSELSGAKNGAGTGKSFLADFEAAEQATELPALTDPGFKAAATARGLAVAKVISTWLAVDPYGMLQELLDQDEQQMPFFRPFIGPVIFFRHASVIKAFQSTEAYTVAPYAPEMAKGTDGAHDRHLPNYFILGTDDESQYRPDGMLLRKAVHKGDSENILRPLIARACEAWTKQAKASGAGQFDSVKTLCRFVPVTICSEYLGMTTFEKGAPSFNPKFKGGDTFDLSLLDTKFKFQAIKEGIIPTPQHVYEWVKDTFRNIFNNFGGKPEDVKKYRELGLIGTEYQTAYMQLCLQHYKAEIAAGRQVPDTMLTRLLKMQADVAAGKGAALAQELGISESELKARLDDGRIRANVFGTVTGAVVNPEEGTARMIDSILRLKAGEYKVLNGSTYAALETAVNGNAANVNQLLAKYAVEALRLQPQGEAVVRRCVKDDNSQGQLVRADTFVFIAHAAAMRDPKVIQDPLAFDATRDPMNMAFEGTTDRKNEAPQSQVYLQHGFGRHKCLGRYASELTLQETLRALVRMGDISRGGPLEMDAQGLYAESLIVKFS